MARKDAKQMRATLQKISALRRQYAALRKQAGKLKREETAIWRGLQSAVRGRTGRLTVVEHRPGRKDKITHPRPARADSLLAVARARGSSGLLCGCSPIRIVPQPNGDIDVCVLIACSNDPATAGFRCEYWCGTLEAEPVVAIARRTRRR